MITFKDFLYEAPRKPKAPKEPNWAEDYESGYGDLKSMQEYLTTDRIRYQLFVPKKRNKDLMADLVRSRRVNDVRREIEDEARLKEETTPILTSYTESPVDGDNKPTSAFWTSTAHQKRNGSYSSDWYDYVKKRHPDWQTDYGFLFEVKSNAMVISTDDLEQYYWWAQRTNRITKEIPDYLKNYGARDQMRSNFPWKSLSKHFDGVHHNGYSSYGDAFTDGWDVESIAWFNTDKLIYKGAVKLWHDYDDDDL